MTKPLKLIAANDTFGALLAVTDALAGKHALFITAPETNGLMPETHNLPDSVEDSIGFVVETSGSTGTPKRIQLTAAAALAAAKASTERLGGSGQWLLALPINYVAGLNVLIRSAVAETQPVMMNTSVSFTAEAFVRSASMMSAERKFTALVPTQLSRLAIAAEQDESVLRALKSFSAILVGGQALHFIPIPVSGAGRRNSSTGIIPEVSPKRAGHKRIVVSPSGRRWVALWWPLGNICVWIRCCHG